MKHDTLPHGGSPSRLIPVTEWNNWHLWPRIGGLRHLIFNAETNGFDAVVRRVGRRCLLSEQAFFAWVDRVGARDDRR
jgi:hypothetical protein